ncbi:MAG TPA: hypothetical protein DIW23_11455 [Anaerolineae bacterium]|nr:hypothetical protein [Anaerolineae bacterium]
MDTTITARDVIGKDPFGKLLARLRIQPWQAALLSLSFFLIYVIVLPIYFDVWLSKTGLERSSSMDRVNQVGFWIIHPTIIFFYVWQSGAIADLYKYVFPLAPTSVLGKLMRVSRMLHELRNWWVIGAISGGIIVYLGVIFIFEVLGERWYSVNWLMAILLQCSRFLLFYMIAIIFIRHLIVAFNLNRIYLHVQFPVMIAQSKYSAVFDAITQYGLSFAGFGAMLGFFIAMRNFYGTPVFPEDTIYILGYVILMPLAFILPFWQAHVSMRLARQKALRDISDKLQDEYDFLMSGSATPDTLSNSSAKIQTLRTLFDLTERAPTWPFENWSIYRVMVATAFPFVMTGLGYVIELFL